MGAAQTGLEILTNVKFMSQRSKRRKLIPLPTHRPEARLRIIWIGPANLSYRYAHYRSIYVTKYILLYYMLGVSSFPISAPAHLNRSLSLFQEAFDVDMACSSRCL